MYIHTYFTCEHQHLHVCNPFVYPCFSLSPPSVAPKVKEYLADPSKFVVAAAPADTTDGGGGGGEKKEEAAKEESEEESDDDMGMGEWAGAGGWSG